jgi:hypothetical protein
MESYQVDILNPKAFKLLKDLADLKLISISKISENSFLEVVKNMRSKEQDVPDLEAITQIVEEVRNERYGKKD